MENASKALIIAGGVLVSILVVSLFIYAWGKFSEYQDAKSELVNINDVSKFNEQFTAYNRNDVMGYELISLIHKVIDYNERYTEDSISNKDTYNNVEMIIDMSDIRN